MGRPVWTDDPAFDLDAHLHRTALPAPGGDDELFEAIARIAEVPLRRDRPLWEMWVIEGLERGRFALVAKIHHAAVDGIGGAQLMCGLLDVDRDARPRRSAEAEPEPEPAPSSATLFADAALSLGAQPLRGAWQILRSAGTGRGLRSPPFRSASFRCPALRALGSTGASVVGAR